MTGIMEWNDLLSLFPTVIPTPLMLQPSNQCSSLRFQILSHLCAFVFTVSSVWGSPLWSLFFLSIWLTNNHSSRFISNFVCTRWLKPRIGAYLLCFNNIPLHPSIKTIITPHDSRLFFYYPYKILEDMDLLYSSSFYFECIFLATSLI